MQIEKLLKDIEDRRLERIEKHQRQYRQDYPRASNIHNCDRNIYLQIVCDPAMKPIPSPELQARFIAGWQIEEQVFKDMLDEGWRLERMSDPFEIKDRDGTMLCTGHMDFRLPYDGEKPVVEVKSLNVNIFNNVDSVKDFQKYFWARKYPRQMLLYLYASGEPFGIFVLSDGLGHRKHFTVSLDDSENMDETERILKRCRYIVDCCYSNKEPEFMDNPEECIKCDFYGSLCNPPLLSKDSDQLKVVTDQEHIEKVARYLEIKEIQKEANTLEKQIKEPYKGQEQVVMVGNALITVKEQKRTKYDVPKEIKEKYKGELSAWKVNIEALEIKKGE